MFIDLPRALPSVIFKPPFRQPQDYPATDPFAFKAFVCIVLLISGLVVSVVLSFPDEATTRTAGDPLAPAPVQPCETPAAIHPDEHGPDDRLLQICSY